MEWPVCPKCNFHIATNRHKHFASCDGLGPRRLRDKDKPRRGKGWAKGLSKTTDEAIAKQSRSLSVAIAAGNVKMSGFAASDYDNEKRRASGKNSGGYRNGAGRGKKIHTADSFGNIVCLQSTHEMKIAEMLNERGVKWRREGVFKYDGRNYFPDFHLVETDVYLDVKNDYLIGVDEPKIRKVREQNPSVRLLVFALRDAAEVLRTIGG